ncbi:MAG: hypothetical protein OEX07_12260 [Gammaproteobacteria bacterium]|nr:hypothetical protein [Gammaproteobacteria bacterium]
MQTAYADYQTRQNEIPAIGNQLLFSFEHTMLLRRYFQNATRQSHQEQSDKTSPLRLG